MLCQNCGKHEATTHLKRIVNGQAAELHLCSSCAGKLGYGEVFSPFDMGFGGLFGNLFSQGQNLLGGETVVRCEKCGATYRDIAESGKVGCADCYKLFAERLAPSLQRIHGKTRHSGKVPGDVQRSDVQSHLESLRLKMAKAIETQNFEEAAKLRDEIRAAEKEAGDNE